MLAVISDVHGNYQALVAVLEQIERLGAERIICLGDNVGYGPQPVECADLARRRCDVVLCGNHEYALIYGAAGFAAHAREALDQQRRKFMPRPGTDDAERAERWQWLKGRPYRHVEGELLFVHASPRDPVNEYLRRTDVLLGRTKKLLANFDEVDWLCFVGHTHRPGVITHNLKFYAPDEIGGVFEPRNHQKAIINVGSVGQPRDNDWRACFVTLDGSTVRFHRVEYDIETTVALLRKDPTSGDLADRLREGR